MKKNLLNIARKKSQRGISTVQVAVTILVGAILIVGGLGAFRYVTGAQMNNDAADIVQWAVKTKELGATQGAIFFNTADNFTVASPLAGTDPLATNGFYTPSKGDFTASGKKVVASGVYTDTGAAVANGNNGIKVTVTSYDQAECREIIPKIMGSVARVYVGEDVVALGGTLTGGLSKCVVGSNVLTVDMRM